LRSGLLSIGLLLTLLTGRRSLRCSHLSVQLIQRLCQLLSLCQLLRR
jgi:hypothetical protein